MMPASELGMKSGTLLVLVSTFRLAMRKYASWLITQTALDQYSAGSCW